MEVKLKQDINFGQIIQSFTIGDLLKEIKKQFDGGAITFKPDHRAMGVFSYFQNNWIAMKFELNVIGSICYG